MDDRNNTGNRNTGSRNPGNYNPGNRNTGNYNPGNWNTGNYNPGNWNTGDWNPGNYNTGNRNPGSYNPGNWNTGDYNPGNRNTGSYNPGNWNTGDYNPGDFNIGGWNTCDRETGFFNTVDSNTVRVFNSDVERHIFKDYKMPSFLYFSLINFVSLEDMTNQEKEDNPTCKNTGGYLKSYKYKDAFKKSWDNADIEDRKRILDCPNFDNDIFLEISGIDVNEELRVKKVTIELTQDQLDKIKHLL